MCALSYINIHEYFKKTFYFMLIMILSNYFGAPVASGVVAFAVGVKTPVVGSN